VSNLIAQCDGCSVELDCQVGADFRAAQKMKALDFLREAGWVVVPLLNHTEFHFCPKCTHLADAVENEAAAPPLILLQVDGERYDIVVDRELRHQVGSVYRAGVGWNAYTRKANGEYDQLGRGDTPTEAFARLRPARFRTTG
jgi:hypothetical protein